jgi:5S rRNA maturation endonuclease (ribonuclease M5)
MKIIHRQKEALEKLILLISEIHIYVDAIIVEGSRDVKSIRSLGCSAEIEVLNHVKISDFDLAGRISSRFRRVVILTDFDEAGLKLNQKFSSLLERNGTTVETGIRHRFGRLMTMIGVHAIESVDNIKKELY